jgi:hypothetical protein
MDYLPFSSTIASARDAARAHGFLRLAEHLDDALLMAASEMHEALAAAAAVTTEAAARAR